MSLLTVRDLTVAYGGIQAARGVSLEIKPGELVCLIGANGAGKSTFLKAVAGLLQPAAGRIEFDGREITALAPHARVRCGMALVPEGRGIFSRLTVTENLQLGAYLAPDRLAQGMEHAFSLFPRLAERRRQIAGTLSGGEQQMLAIARALMSQPRLLLLDEPSMGLAPILVRKVFEIIRRISAEGTTLLLVEQNARLALEVSHRGYVMESGRVVLADSAANLLKDPGVQRAYLGVAVS
jgi:branched-chain amino acid transport system ATP-binding protein